jgi:hypothetical protein
MRLAFKGMRMRSIGNSWKAADLAKSKSIRPWEANRERRIRIM